MSYFTPFIDAAGLHTPTYQDIENYLVGQAKAIYGDDIYLGNDSQDFQLIATMALGLYDVMQSAHLAYNSRSPVTAIGTALDGIIALNGIVRDAASFSTVIVTITGTAYTEITKGIISDINNNRWNLPDSVIIGSGGTIDVTATAQQIGAITALAHQVSNIQTPTFGWTSVDNAGAAVLGQPIEQDSQLKARQALSVANPSQALTTGILGSILAVPNVINAVLYENDTGTATDVINGAHNAGHFPPHSITCVVNGGDGLAVAQAIYDRKTPGCYTNGDQSHVITDQYNVATTIRFFLQENKAIDVQITIAALGGYTSAIGTLIKQNIADYINGLKIGENIIISELWRAALAVDTSRQYPYFSLTTLTADLHGGTPAATNITLEFNQQATCIIANITLTVS